ncbi:MAG: class I SAM-dependent rRNA methyltransferase [Oscillospiraceae bacterium]|nr:class I SAM-dependent rRNA methyltransferase [Oscillospiraceae bacterium]
MKTERIYPAAVVTPKAESSLKKGHPWIYDTEIKSIEGECINGCLTDVFSVKGSYLGTGIVSEKSKIRIRILSTNANDKFDEAFFKRRLKYAIDYRRTVMGEDFSNCRLVFGEADGLPGLTVDRYDNLVVTQVLSFGMDKLKDIIYRGIYEILTEYGEKIDGIYERNDVAIRELEGLENYKGWYESDFIKAPASPLTEINENGIIYSVDVENGQKTGFFLDQKYNRLAVAKLAKGMKVLDCFTHTGSFALNAAMGGAAHVTAVDVSQTAIDKAKENAVRNGLDGRMDFLCTNVFDLLPTLKKGEYDFIILDPPAFTKNRKTISDAERGYKEINFRAMKALNRGGYLATCSCSHFMDNKLFVKMLMSAAADANVSLKLIELRRQSPDHPTLLNVPETDYLKFYLFQVV